MRWIGRSGFRSGHRGAARRRDGALRGALAALLIASLFAGGAATAWADDAAPQPDPAANAQQAPAAAITTQPEKLTSAAAGSAVQLAVVATDASAYQWERLTDGADPAKPESWKNVDGAANPSALTAKLEFAAVSPSDAGSYRVRLTGADGTELRSEVAVLEVVVPEPEPQAPATPDETDGANGAEGSSDADGTAADDSAAPQNEQAGTSGAQGIDTEVAAAAGLKIDAHPESVSVAFGATATFSAKASGGQGRADAQWQRSTGLSATNEPATWTNISGATLATLEVKAGTNPHLNNRWYRVVFTDAAGKKATSKGAKLSIDASAKPSITEHPDPLGQTVEEGGTASFSAAASGKDVTVQWQRSDTALPNGEPDDDAWRDIDGATAPTYTLNGVKVDDHGAFFRAVFSNADGRAVSRAGELRVSEALDTEGSVTVSGESYGPVKPDTPFSVSAPNAVVRGQQIVISGEDYLATDKKTGSVVNFMIDATYSGDPNTLYTTRTITNPVDGKTFADKRSHGIAKAGADGKWRISIPWPNETNTTKDKAFFDENWAPGTQHTVRILSGSLLTNPADYQRGITVRFTVVDAKTGAVAPSITAHPTDAKTEGGTPVTFSAAAGGVPAPAVQWQTSSDGGTWADVEGATKRDYTLRDPKLAQNGHLFRAVFTSRAGSATTDPARLEVTSEPVVVTENPKDASVEAGERAVFTAAARGPELSVRWEVSENGGPWKRIRGATSPTYSVERAAASDSGNRYRAVFTNPAWPDGDTSEAATLTVTDRANVREYCGRSSGPSTYAGQEFCFTGPEKVKRGEDIVIRGTGGFLATDGATGSVMEFSFDSLYSSDPNTLYTRKLAKNPLTKKDITDARIHAAVQADADGTWKVTIPWPTVEGVSKTRDGAKNFTQKELDARFAAGTTHGIRMLSGSLLSKPQDLTRGATLLFTVVDDLDDPVEVKKPVYKHETLKSDATGDSAVVWVPSEIDSGTPFPLTGTGWKTKDGEAGSTIALRLRDENGDYYERSGGEGDAHELPSDPTVWRVIHVGADGVLDAGIDLPDSVKGGSYVAVELTTSDDGTAEGDVERKLVSKAMTLDGSPWVKPVETGCTAKAGQETYTLAPGMKVPAARAGGTIRLTGKNWCNKVTGKGSYVAVKINDGAYSHPGSSIAKVFNAKAGKVTGNCKADICKSNKTIWHVIEADDQGNFDAEIPIPKGSESTPAMKVGDSYSLRIMTGTLAGDPQYGGVREDSRTLKSPDFTLVCATCDPNNAKAGKPTLPPEPLHATDDLTDKKRGGVKVQVYADRWVVTVPKGKPGDWVYVNVYDDLMPTAPWGKQWFELDKNRRATLPLSGVRLPTGTNQVSVQDRNEKLLGWTQVTVNAPTTSAPARPAFSGGGSGGGGGFLTAPTKQIAPKPEWTPKKPVAKYADLKGSNDGGLKAEKRKGKLVVTFPDAEGGDWVYLFVYTERGKIASVGWVQIGDDQTVVLSLKGLPKGKNKLAFVDDDDELVGWVYASGGKLPEAQTAGGAAAVSGTGAAAVAAAVLEAVGDDWTLILIGLALLILAGAAIFIIMMRQPIPTAAQQTGPGTA